MSLECLVGVMLVGLGLATLIDWWQRRVHVHNHQHDAAAHVHFHAHADDVGHSHSHRLRLGVRNRWRLVWFMGSLVVLRSC